MKVSVRCLVLIAVLASASCASRPTPMPSGSAAIVQNGVSDRLYFGRSIPGGGVVTEENWAAFLNDVVTPRFPAGFTVWQAKGQWQEKSGAIVREDSFVLEVIHIDRSKDALVGEIIAEYKRRFRQEAVLRVRDRMEVEFR